MKTRVTFFLLSFVIAGFILFSGNCFAQQKQEDQTNAKKTITIHVTKEVNGSTVVIDTTVVTDGDFDADAFLEEKGVMNDMPQTGKNVEKHIIIRHPDSKEFHWNDSDGNSPDTLIIDDDRALLFDDNIDMPFPPQSERSFNFDMPQGFRHRQGPQFEDIMEGMARSLGLENVLPFGEMKQVIVKKKHNGKKVIITFEDRDRENRDIRNKKEENGIIYKNSDQGIAPQNEKHIIIKRDKGDKVMVKENSDKTAPLKKEIRVTVIEDGKK